MTVVKEPVSLIFAREPYFSEANFIRIGNSSGYLEMSEKIMVPNKFKIAWRERRQAQECYTVWIKDKVVGIGFY